ncbi:astacin-like metalloprotease toxin 5 [Pollicipes pollicipes]|uniref:astacin-like metalloprotease toxin 5 n=1 Tax=Pollicipes pollicipes TaxID=41117 RepID=UPI0018858A5E|nr:astacin-like metalloprotease toxin 5 [Pollicipes pollicipes]
MARNRYELAAVGEGQAPRKGGRRCGVCPVWVWILLILVVLLLIGAGIASYFVRKLVIERSIYPARTDRLYVGGEGITEGDMLGVNTTESDHVAKDSQLLWPLARIPYRLDDRLGCPDSPRCEVLMEAIEEFNNSTCLLWEPAKDSDKYAVSIQLKRHGGCYSSVGYQGSTGADQLIVLGEGCFNIGIILHEMGHTVGFWHEHNRPDRDQWLKIDLENADGAENFDAYDRSRHPVTDSLDFKSVMMLGTDAFSAGNGSTMSSHWPDVPVPQLTNKTMLSDKDINRVRYLYGEQCRKRMQSSAGL